MSTRGRGDMNAPILSNALLLHGEAPTVLAALPACSIDMAYCDPPFGNEQEWRGRAGSFSDRWRTTEASDAGWKALCELNPVGMEVFLACALPPQNMAYLGMMAGIMVAVRRVLKPRGSLWMHFDDTMGAYLRLLGQSTFGMNSESGTLIWKRTFGGHANAKSFGRVHDTIACFARSPCCPLWGSRFDDFARAAPLAPGSKERIGYPTQKPIALLAELITIATRPGDIVVDPTCGSGTTLVAAQQLGRRAIGIDISNDALSTARARLGSSMQESFL